MLARIQAKQKKVNLISKFFVPSDSSKFDEATTPKSPASPVSPKTAPISSERKMEYNESAFSKMMYCRNEVFTTSIDFGNVEVTW